MSAWLASAIAFSLALAPCGYLALRGKDSVTQLVGLEAAGILETIILLLLSQSANQPSFYDVALAMAILTFGGSLVFVKFLERWE